MRLDTLSRNMKFVLRNYLYLGLVFGLALCGTFVSSQDFGFPERGDESVSKQNAANRRPIWIPGRCNENELLYPGDQADDWICDCSPGFLFHPGTDKCYLAYRQGPCSQGNYLTLPSDKVIPQCVTNPCQQDGRVLVRNRCYVLGQPGPCSQPELSYVLGVNTNTLSLSCVRLSMTLETRFGEEEVSTTAPTFNDVPLCARGCRRAVNGTCPVIQDVNNVIGAAPGSRA